MLETGEENMTALLLGLEYLINISYVDDTEVFKVVAIKYTSLSNLFLISVFSILNLSELVSE